MVIGHFAAGVIGKKLEPTVSIWACLGAALLPDIAAILFMLVPNNPIDRVFWTHGLVSNIVMALLVLIVTIIITKKVRVGFILGLIVMSHWLLDFISWSPENRGLPIGLEGSEEVGLRLYESTWGIVAGELIGLYFLIFFALKLTKVDSE